LETSSLKAPWFKTPAYKTVCKSHIFSFKSNLLFSLEWHMTFFFFSNSKLWIDSRWEIYCGIYQWIRCKFIHEFQTWILPQSLARFWGYEFR
jgi:hypothetical protein